MYKEKERGGRKSKLCVYNLCSSCGFGSQYSIFCLFIYKESQRDGRCNLDKSDAQAFIKTTDTFLLNNESHAFQPGTTSIFRNGLNHVIFSIGTLYLEPFAHDIKRIHN